MDSKGKEVLEECLSIEKNLTDLTVDKESLIKRNLRDYLVFGIDELVKKIRKDIEHGWRVDKFPDMPVEDAFVLSMIGWSGRPHVFFHHNWETTVQVVDGKLTGDGLIFMRYSRFFE